MRLTLRTLLAYMDQILDPADHEDLGRKIESSDFATELIHRTRDVLRRLRLGAPAVDDGDNDEVLGGSPNLDANAVAEYLDNTMSPEQVAEFERCCLEVGADADMRLAEVASCHHVLTMVLGEPAEVRPEVRQRMYALKQHAGVEAPTDGNGEKLRIEPAHSPLESETTIAAAPPVAQVVTESTLDEPREQEEVPDYLRAAAQAERRGRNLRFAAVAAALLIGAGLTYLFWPQGEVEVPKRLAGVNTDAVSEGLTVAGEAGSAADTEAGISGAGADEAPPFVPPTTGEAPSEPASTETPAAQAETVQETSAVEMPEVESMEVESSELENGGLAPGVELPPRAGSEDLAGDEMTNGGLADETPFTAPATMEPDKVQPNEAIDASADSPVRINDNGEVEFALDVPEVNLEETPATGDAPAMINRPTGAPAETASAQPTDNATAESGTTESAGAADLASAAPPALPTPPSSDGDTNRTTAGPAKPVQLGNYLGDNDVLLRLDPAAQVWQRLPNRTALAAGDRLLALPKFRVHLGLASGLNAALSGGTQVTLAPKDIPESSSGESPKESDITLRLAFGRLLLVAGLEGSRVNLVLGDHAYKLNLKPSTSLAIAAQRHFVPGSDAATPGPMEAHWYLTSGEASWSGEDVNGPLEWTTIDGRTGEMQAISELPDWVDREPVTELERSARERVSDAIAVGDQLNIRLLELADSNQLGRRSEVRSLAVESGAYVGVFEPFVKSLNDEKQRANWDDLITTMRQAIARDPRSAELLREDFVSLRGEREAGDLMEMLLGYGKEAIGATPEQRKEGVLPQLIRWLDSDQLDYRVLASYNLNDITGKHLGGYRPERSASQRRTSIARYWKDLEDEQLKPREDYGK